MPVSTSHSRAVSVPAPPPQSSVPAPPSIRSSPSPAAHRVVAAEAVDDVVAAARRRSRRRRLVPLSVSPASVPVIVQSTGTAVLSESANRWIRSSFGQRDRLRLALAVETIRWTQMFTGGDVSPFWL